MFQIRKRRDLSLTTLNLETYYTCTHRCLYCWSNAHYSQYIAPKLKFEHPTSFFEPSKPSNPLEAIQFFSGKGRYSELFHNKIPIHWGNAVDPFSANDKIHKIGQIVLKQAKKNNYPMYIATKSPWLADDYNNLLYGNIVLMSSFTSTNNSASRMIEQGTPLTKRLKMIEKARKKVKKVVVRLEPYIVGLTDKYIEQSIKDFKNAGVDGLTVNFLFFEKSYSKRSMGYLEEVDKLVGSNSVEFARRGILSRNITHRPSWADRKPYIEQLEKLCQEAKIDFFYSKKETKASAVYYKVYPFGDYGEFWSNFLKKDNKKLNVSSVYTC